MKRMISIILIILMFLSSSISHGGALQFINKLFCILSSNCIPPYNMLFSG